MFHIRFIMFSCIKSNLQLKKKCSEYEHVVSIKMNKLNVIHPYFFFDIVWLNFFSFSIKIYSNLSHTHRSHTIIHTNEDHFVIDTEYTIIAHTKATSQPDCQPKSIHSLQIRTTYCKYFIIWKRFSYKIQKKNEIKSNTNHIMMETLCGYICCN